MCVSGRNSFIFFAAVLVSLACAAPVVTFAGGTATPAPPAQPRPDREKKIWTNDDVERLNPAFGIAAAPQPGVASAPSAAGVRPVAIALPSGRAATPLIPEQDPRWYAQQLAPLEAELTGIATQEQQLRQFRDTSSGLPTGLVLDAPCEGITTDNRIAQLESIRQQILQQIDDLSDTARRNGLPPGILVEGRGRVQESTRLNTVGQKAALIAEFQERSDELAQTQEVVAYMQSQAAAQGMTLLQPVPGEGGNMTTDLLQRLDSRADALQSQLSSAEDAARSLGIPPGDLR